MALDLGLLRSLQLCIVVCITSWRLCTDHSAVTSLRCLLPIPVLPPTDAHCSDSTGPWYHHPQQCTWIRNLGIIPSSSPLTTHPHHIGWWSHCTDCAFWNPFTILITSLTVQGPSLLACLQESPSLTQWPQCTTLYPITGAARPYLKSSSSPPTHKVLGPRQNPYGHYLTPTCLFRPISCASPV